MNWVDLWWIRKRGVFSSPNISWAYFGRVWSGIKIKNQRCLVSLYLAGFLWGHSSGTLLDTLSPSAPDIFSPCLPPGFLAPSSQPSASAHVSTAPWILLLPRSILSSFPAQSPGNLICSMIAHVWISSSVPILLHTFSREGRSHA